MTEASSKPTWTFEDETFPLFPFDEPQQITLLNGTIHQFKPWSIPVERKRETALKSIVTTSPAVFNGENPVNVKTDFTRSSLLYYELMIDRIGGVSLDGVDQNGSFLDAHQVVEGQVRRDGKPARILDLVAPSIRKQAASRLYGGRYEVEKPDLEDEAPEYNPYEDEDEGLLKSIEKQEKRQTVYALSLDRTIVVRQDIGIEQLANGSYTDPTHRIRYHFNDPDDKDFSKWELKAQEGFLLNRKDGGTTGESYYNLGTLASLFDKLINKVQGASLHGAPIELPEDRDDPARQALLAMVPYHCKKMSIVQVFREANILGNA